jgi:hypothetical protein
MEMKGFFIRLILFLFFSGALDVSLAADRLEGMYLMTRFSGGSLQTSAYYFTPAGEVFEEPTGGSDFQAFKASAPQQAGKYMVSGDKMRIEWGGKRRALEAELERKERGCFYFNGGLFCPVKPFPKDAKLEGRYSGGGTAGGGTGAVVSSASSITFKPDGTYSTSAIGGVSATVGGTSVGKSSSSSAKGKYQLDQYTLTLKGDDGTIQKRTVFPYDTNRLYFEGSMMKKEN